MELNYGMSLEQKQQLSQNQIQSLQILAMDNTIRRMVVNHDSVEAITAYAREHQHMRTLKESGLILVKEGVTTPEELMKISYE